jgi:hypothetical protein
MTWALSRFRAGDVVEVRSKEEILATLDDDGCVEGMPFMPEMLQFCGGRFRVSAVAHKTCETALRTYKGRRLNRTVHLQGLRCDGSAHGGCEADCNLFWKDVWLKPAGAEADVDAEATAFAKGGTAPLRCTEERLLANAQLPSEGPECEFRYSCQATRLFDATAPLKAWDPRQYVFDVVTRNHSVGRVFRVVWLASLRELLRVTPIGYRAVRWFSDRMHRWLTGRPTPALDAKIPSGQPTPTGRLGLQAGELVRIKPKEAIEETIDAQGKNRGLSFDIEEMAPYCGGVYKVRRTVTRILDEETGKMLRMKQPCIILEDVVCRAEYARCRLNCPRAFPAYWRELWLERVGPDPQENRQGVDEAPRTASSPSPHPTPAI